MTDRRTSTDRRSSTERRSTAAKTPHPRWGDRLEGLDLPRAGEQAYPALAPGTFAVLNRTLAWLRAEAGVQAVASLTQYQHHFAQQLNARMNGVDLTIPENQPFRAAAKEMQDEFSEYMNKMHFSNPAALQALASQVSQFDKKLDALPQAYRKSKMRKTAYPDARKVSETAQQAVPPAPLGGEPAPQAQIPAY